MSWMIEHSLSDTVAHLCWLGEGRGGARWGQANWAIRGSSIGKASIPFSPETATRWCCKNIQCFQCFLLDASHQAHYPSKCGCCSCLSPWAPWLTVHLVFWLACSRCLWPSIKHTAEARLNCHLLWKMWLLIPPPSPLFQIRGTRPWKHSLIWVPRITLQETCIMHVLFIGLKPFFNSLNLSTMTLTNR